MKPNLQFDFIVDRTKNTLTIKREFAANRQLVWDCHTKRELLDQWFSPKTFTTKTKTMDFQEGGYWHYVMISPEGQEFGSRLDYQTIRPIDGYTAIDGFCDETGALNMELPKSKWDVTFTDIAEHTLVQTIVTHESRKDLETIIEMGMEEGMASTLERLDELLMTLTRGEN